MRCGSVTPSGRPRRPSYASTSPAGGSTQDELDERLTAVFAAKTRGDLNALFTDLPSSGHGWASASAPGSGSFGGPVLVLGPGLGLVGGPGRR